jgi:succinyl-diaminopimelate desuccinylase
MTQATISHGDYIAGSEAELIIIELEKLLTAIPALSPDSAGCGELDKCLTLEEWLRANGITELERIDAPDPRAKGGVRPNLIATIQGESNEQLWLISHLDVVPAGVMQLWQTDPWQLVVEETAEHDKKLIGRGTEDNQAGLCSSVLAVLALKKCGVKPRRTVKLLFAADEEVGSVYGIDWLIENKCGLFHADDLVLIPDGGDKKGETVEIAEKNLLWAKFEVHGKQSHGSRPDLGKNAAISGAALAVALDSGLKKKFARRDALFEPPYSTFELTKKDANIDNINTIPGEDVFYFDMRILPCYPLKLVIEEIDNIAATIEAEHGVKVTRSFPQQRESKATATDSPLVTMLGNAVKKVLSVELRPIGIGGGTVAAGLRQLGIQCAVWSVMDDVAHQPNEYVLVSSIVKTAQVMAELMMTA